MSFKRDNIIGELVKGYPNTTVKTDLPVPEVTYKSVQKNRMLCRTNMCGHYNSSWTCPPNCGTSEYCIERISSYKLSDVVMRRYDNVDFSNKEMVDGMMNDFRDMCRDIMIKCREQGFDVIAFADGPCSYCEECAFKKGKKCYHPEMQVPSVSGYGIDMTSYLSQIGVKFGFSKDSVTLYGIFLFK